MNRNIVQSFALVLVATLALVAVVGCGGGDKKKAVKGGDKAALGELVSGLDGGRLAVAGPKGWEMQSRSSQYAIKFNNPKVEGQSLYVSAEAPPAGLDAISLENAGQLKSAIGKKAENAKIEDVGGVVCVQYAYISQGNDFQYQNVVFATIQAGRRYDFVLRSFKTQSADPRLLARVVRGAKFGEAAKSTLAAETGAIEAGGSPVAEEDADGDFAVSAEADDGSVE